jgi:AcrR family transcriptional regulator
MGRLWVRKVDEANTDAKRKIILLAAMRCFAKNGLQRTSIKDICKESGMNSGHLYYYFANKDAILEASYEIATKDIAERIEHVLEGDDIVAAILNLHADAEAARLDWHMGPGLRLEFIAETARNDRLKEIADDLSRCMTSAIKRAAERAIASGQLDSRIDAQTFTRILGLIWTGLGTLRVDKRFDLAEYEQAIAALLRPWLPAEAKGRQPAGRKGAEPDRAMAQA